MAFEVIPEETMNINNDVKEVVDDSLVHESKPTVPTETVDDEPEKIAEPIDDPEKKEEVKTRTITIIEDAYQDLANIASIFGYKDPIGFFYYWLGTTTKQLDIAVNNLKLAVLTSLTEQRLLVKDNIPQETKNTLQALDAVWSKEEWLVALGERRQQVKEELEKAKKEAAAKRAKEELEKAADDMQKSDKNE